MSKNNTYLSEKNALLLSNAHHHLNFHWVVTFSLEEALTPRLIANCRVVVAKGWGGYGNFLK